MQLVSLVYLLCEQLAVGEQSRERRAKLLACQNKPVAGFNQTGLRVAVEKALSSRPRAGLYLRASLGMLNSFSASRERERLSIEARL